MYDPIHIPAKLTRRRVITTLVMIFVALTAIVVTVVRTRPHPPPTDPLTLDELALMVVPDAAETAMLTEWIKAQIAQEAVPAASPHATPSACVAPKTPHKWDSTQRANAKTIVQVGMALDLPKRAEIIALATAMQESQLYNLGDLGANNDHDSLGLFQQRPSMGWGTPAQVRDPVYAATAFYLALQRVNGWESMALTAAAQRVQRSAFPNAYAKWETDATALNREILCTLT
ncbi:MAG TPA: hypothetical protein VH561_18085 [Micromonosporaceae bacterium]|jgi:hypothetical protein